MGETVRDPKILKVIWSGQGSKHSKGKKKVMGGSEGFRPKCYDPPITFLCKGSARENQPGQKPFSMKSSRFSADFQRILADNLLAQERRATGTDSFI